MAEVAPFTGVRCSLRCSRSLMCPLDTSLRHIDIGITPSAISCQSSLALFLPQWQGVDEHRRGAERLLEVIGQLQDLALPWSLWSTVVLPRVTTPGPWGGIGQGSGQM